MENKQNIKDLIQKFYPHAKEKLGFDHPVRVIMRQDAENAQQSLGKTAYYDPAEKLIVLYVTNRHPKDVLRSFSHELVHHAQNCRGELDDLSTDAHYAKDGKGREIEAEAYLLGNGFLVRDWEDGMKHEGVNEMKLTKTQLKSIIEKLVKEQVANLSKGSGEREGEGDKQKPKKVPKKDQTGVPADHVARSPAELVPDVNKGNDKMKRTADTSIPKDPSVDEQDDQVAVSTKDGQTFISQPATKDNLPPAVQRALDQLQADIDTMDEKNKEMFAQLLVKMPEIMAALEKDGDAPATGVATSPIPPDPTVDEISPVPTPIPNRDKDDELEEEYDPKRADLNKDGEVSDYEEKRGKAAFGESKKNNKSWYDSNLYESLKSKWTK